MPKNQIPTVEAMAAELEPRENRLTKGKSYNQISAEIRKQAIYDAIEHQREQLRESQEHKVNLRDTDDVIESVDRYMQACQRRGIAPTICDYAPRIGLSRQAIYQWIDRNPDHPTAKYLDAVRSSWAAIIQSLGLSRIYGEASAIFCLKNSAQGMADKIEITTAIPASDINEFDADTISKRYLTE